MNVKQYMHCVDTCAKNYITPPFTTPPFSSFGGGPHQMTPPSNKSPPPYFKQPPLQQVGDPTLSGRSHYLSVPKNDCIPRQSLFLFIDRERGDWRVDGGGGAHFSDNPVNCALCFREMVSNMFYSRWCWFIFWWSNFHYVSGDDADILMIQTHFLKIFFLQRGLGFVTSNWLSGQLTMVHLTTTGPKSCYRSNSKRPVPTMELTKEFLTFPY